MAKSRKRRSGKKGRKGGTTVAKPKYAGRQYDCYGKRVRTGKGNKKAPRVFCGKLKT